MINLPVLKFSCAGAAVQFPPLTSSVVVFSPCPGSPYYYSSTSRPSAPPSTATAFDHL